MAYHYKLVRMRASSEKYGKCEVCNEFSSDVYLQVETKDYVNRLNGIRQTAHNCIDLFGHLECLKNSQRKEE